jgi:hypothetical protein
MTAEITQEIAPACFQLVVVIAVVVVIVAIRRHRRHLCAQLNL